MNDAIKAEGLGKRYRVLHKSSIQHDTLRDALADSFRSLWRHDGPSSVEMFWALKDVSFEISGGERVGIIGRNGAGKSTLLKMLSRITEPTTGRITVAGRVASLLEVGTGFHPELTGRENIYLNGAVLGMNRHEVRRQFDEIVAFAEIERFLDTPVKRYSSGMYTRLAFSVAAHLEQEILLVDEVLAVGDAAFQKKCLNKIRSTARSGRTVLFVSHNMGTVQSLCNRVLFLEDGRIAMDGDASETIRHYLMAGADQRHTGEISWTESAKAPGNEDFRLLGISLLDPGGRVTAQHDIQNPIRIDIRYRIINPLRNIRLVLKIKLPDGTVAFASTDHNLRGDRTLQPGTYYSSCLLPAPMFNQGTYIVDVACHQPGERVLLQGEDFLRFQCSGMPAHGSFYPESWPGVLAPALKWEIDRPIAD
jgi:lipopolysaccharide transport system ATP-binding protein